MQNLLEKSVIRNTEVDIQTVTYAYNYFGQRIRKTNGIEEVRYLTDITRDHYNLLAQSINWKTTSFTYDDNVVSFERGGTRNYYQLDELGSTMYLTGTDGAAYNPYAYDPFGNILDPTTGKRRRTQGFKQSKAYTREGNLIQPFAFTGYREEENGLYYAQARSYDPKTGRFTGEDRVRGLLSTPETVNHYIYCFNNPNVFIDFNGLWPSLASIGEGLKSVGEGITKIAETAVNGVTSAAKYAVEHPVGTLAAVGAGVIVGAAVVLAAPVVLGGLATAAVGAGISASVVGVAGATATFAVAGAAGAMASDFVKQEYEINYYHEREKFDVNELKAAGVGGFVTGAAIGLSAYGAGITALESASNVLGASGITATMGGMNSAISLPTIAYAGFMGSSASSGYYQAKTTGMIDPYQMIGDGIAGSYLASITYMGGKIASNAIRSCTSENASGIPESAKNYDNSDAWRETFKEEIKPQVKTDPDTAYFWSGRTDGVGGAENAANIAKSRGGVTLESTIESNGVDMPEWDFNDPSSMEAWDMASAAYAEQVSGEVHAVVGADLRPGNIWENTELPRLMNNPNVTEIITVDPKTGVETVIFER